MDKFLFGGWLLVAVVVATTQAVPQFQHLYLGYVSPFEFLQGLRHNAGYNTYQAYRNKRSAMMGGHMDYDYHNQPSAPRHQDAMPAYTPSFHYNPMMYPYKMFTYPSMKFSATPKFPEMKFPTMPSFHFPSFNNYHHPIMPSYNTGYKPAYRPSSASNPPNNHPFGDHFMKMMGFHSGADHGSSTSNNNYQANNHGNGYAYNNNNVNHGNHGNSNYNNPKGNNYDMSYSNSYSMNMDYTNGKGHMVTKDSSYMNDNGKVYRHDGPEKHYMSHGDGKFMPVNNYNEHN